MTNKTLFGGFLILMVCAAAYGLDQPGLIGSGSTRSHDGWRLSYSTVAKPALAGQHTSIESGVTHTDAEGGRPLVFHRFLGDAAAKTYFGYDVVVEAQGRSAKLKFRPIAARPDGLPEEYQAAGARLLAIREFPAETFQSGQTMAITLLTNPATGQKVVDYIHVDISYLDAIGQAIEDWISAFHRHVRAHQKAFHER